MTDDEHWLPPGKRAAVCFSIDDVHPAKSSDAYEAGGDLGAGALGHVARLLERHPLLKVTLFTTPDWREISPAITRRWMAAIPVVRDRVFLTAVLPRGTMRLDRHPGFVSFVKSMPRTEVGLHGLHHVHPGKIVMIEFQRQNAAECERMLRRGLEIFRAAGLEATGMTPPGWNAPPALLDAMAQVGLEFIASARDLATDVARGATAQMSGLRGVPLFEPAMLHGHRRLVHIPANFQATSTKERAFEIIEIGGLLSIKAHIVKNAMGHISLDGIDALYCNYLDSLFCLLEQRYGDQLWWTSMNEVAARVIATGVATRTAS